MAQPCQNRCRQIQATKTASIGLAYDFLRFLRLPLRGSSILKYLQEQQDAAHPQDHVTGWELFGQKAIRQGDWKALYIPAPNGPERWQLYHLGEDAGEVNDLADVYPERLTALLSLWQTYVDENGVVEVTRAHNPLIA